MKIKYFILALGMLGSSLVAQTPEKITFKDTQNHYLKLVPKGKPEGLDYYSSGRRRNRRRSNESGQSG
jgi:hypothetical protein